MARNSVSSLPPLRECVVHDTAELPRGGARVVLERQRRDHGDAVGAGGNDFAGIARIDSGNAAQREFRGAPAKHADDAAQSGRADRRVWVVLRGGRKHATNACIVKKLDRRRLGLLDGLHRKPDDRVGAEKPARILDRHVLLPDMRAVGAGRERNVDTIVDQQRYAERRQRRLDRPRAIDHASRISVLVPQLHQRRAALRDEPRQHREIAAIGAFGIDQCIEAKVNTHCTQSYRLNWHYRSHYGINDIMRARDVLATAGPCLLHPYLLDCAARPSPARRREWSPSSSRSNANSASPTRSRISSPTPSSHRRSIQPPAITTCW